MHHNGIACRHTAFDEVLVSLVTHLVELAIALDLSGGNELLAAHSFGLLIIAIGHAFFEENVACAKGGHLPPRGYHCRIIEMFLGETRKHAVFFAHKAPGFLCWHVPEQLEANAVHLGSMQQVPFSLAGALEDDGSCMEGVMTGFAQRQEIRLFIASSLLSEDDVMHFKPLIFRFSFALLAGVGVSCEHVGFGIGKPIVHALLLQPLVV